MDTNINQIATVEKTISSYNEKHWLVSELKTLIQTKYSALFYAVIIHGSFATNELVNFSDFDGLLIVDEDHEGDELLEAFKKESMKLIYKFDPLQHHGWFQILKSDLANFPQSYLPHEILDHAKLIYPETPNLTLSISINEDTVDYKSSLTHVLTLVEKQMNLNWKNERIYLLKSYLSKVMLLPSLYYAYQNSKGVFKKESFELVKPDFSSKEWEAIEKATAIRQSWKFSATIPKAAIMSRPNKVFRKLTKHWIAPKIDKKIAHHLNNDFKVSLYLFIRAIKSKL